MGRKGVSKRKPKTKSKPVSKAETNSPSNSPIQSLVKNAEATLHRDGTNPGNGSNKKNRKGK
jgi:hypothetical protein